jgi:hypothetical protein
MTRAAIMLGVLATGCATSFDASTTAGATKSINAFGFALYDRLALQQPSSRA